MLTTAPILMSLGTDPVNARNVPSDRADATGISFAESFDESSALAGEMQTQISDGGKLKDAVDAVSVVPAKIVDAAAALAGIKVQADASAGDKIQDESGDAKSLTSLKGAKGTSIPSGVAVTGTGGKLSHGHKSKESTSTAIKVEVPDEPPSSGKVKDVPQKSTLGAIDVGKTDDTDGTAVSGEDIALSVTPPIPNDGVKQVIQKHKEVLVSDSNQETLPIKKMAKGLDDVSKTDKATKLEEKAEKTAGIAVSAVGIEPKTVSAVAVMALQADTQQQKLSAVQDDDAFSAVASVAPGRSVGMTSVVDNKAGKKTAVAGKTDGDSTKAVASVLGDDTASKKSGTDAPSMAASASKVADGDNAKTQSVVTAGGPAHAVPGVPGVTFGGVPGAAVVHETVARMQTTETNAHAATAQAGSGGIDPADSIDATHKTLMATPTSLEVGVANGTHGWLKIRAELTGGGVVNASLSTATSSGQEMLHRELPSLAAYLQSERVAVNTVVVQPTVVAGADARGLAGGMNGDGSGQAQQSGNQGGENRQGAANTVLSRVEKDVAYNGPNRVGRDEPLLPGSYASGGSWLSVRA